MDGCSRKKQAKQTCWSGRVLECGETRRAAGLLLARNKASARSMLYIIVRVCVLFCVERVLVFIVCENGLECCVGNTCVTCYPNVKWPRRLSCTNAHIAFSVRPLTVDVVGRRGSYDLRTCASWTWVRMTSSTFLPLLGSWATSPCSTWAETVSERISPLPALIYLWLIEKPC